MMLICGIKPVVHDGEINPTVTPNMIQWGSNKIYMANQSIRDLSPIKQRILIYWLNSIRESIKEDHIFRLFQECIFTLRDNSSIEFTLAFQHTDNPSKYYLTVNNMNKIQQKIADDSTYMKQDISTDIIQKAKYNPLHCLHKVYNGSIELPTSIDSITDEQLNEWSKFKEEDNVQAPVAMNKSSSGWGQPTIYVAGGAIVGGGAYLAAQDDTKTVKHTETAVPYSPQREESEDLTVSENITINPNLA